MEVRFTPEQETQLSQIATHAGTDVEGLIKEAALRLLQEESRFRAAVREGIAQAHIRWTPAAAADLQTISDYLKEHHPG